jgi:hypothetical protein
METPLNNFQLETIYDTVLRAEDARKEEVKELSDLFAENARLIITPNNKCACSCLHCVADSTPSGDMMSYKKFSEIDPEFFNIFSAADFGRRGNPLLYNSEGHDLADLLHLLHDNGINEFTLALALQEKKVPALERLTQFKDDNQEISLGTMITYHHYYKNLDTIKHAQNFNSTLKHYIKFSDDILISLLGDNYSQQPSKADEVMDTFRNNWDIIFANLEIEPIEKGILYKVKYEGKEAQLKIPSLDTRLYPLGRFKQYLSDKGVLEDYTIQFNQQMGDYACPDLIKWPGIIIEPDGSLNLCASFEAINCNGAVVSNIFKTYSEVKEELMQLYQKEFNWFVKNLPDVIAGNVSTCKMKNNCYSK